MCSLTTPDDGRKDRPKHVECFARINNLRNWCILLVILGNIIIIIIIIISVNFVFYYHFTDFVGTAVAQWLRCCATNRKVAGSITDGVSPSDRTMALGSTQLLIEMSTRSISWG
jgi:hypothetical protein